MCNSYFFLVKFYFKSNHLFHIQTLFFILILEIWLMFSAKVQLHSIKIGYLKRDLLYSLSFFSYSLSFLIYFAKISSFKKNTLLSCYFWKNTHPQCCTMANKCRKRRKQAKLRMMSFSSEKENPYHWDIMLHTS